MSRFSIAVMLAALLMSVQQAAAAEKATDEPRLVSEIKKELHAVLREEALAKNQAERAAAIRHMTVLFRELRLDPRLETVPLIKQFKTQLWSRLTNVKKELERKIARQERLARRQSKSKTGSSPTTQLTQRQQQQAVQTSQGLASQLALISYSMGGPGQMLAESGGAFGGAPRDDGAALVELIERTICPDFWDVNGGPGTIMYYAPLRVLVVRATGEVHGNVRGVIGGLRKAGP